jgi:hypothetical protein
MAKLPTWQAHHVANYDSTMMAGCAALLGEITSDPVLRREILADPRHLHRELFAPFAPPHIRPVTCQKLGQIPFRGRVLAALRGINWPLWGRWRTVNYHRPAPGKCR